MLVTTPTIFYTRLGIGISDPRWWEYRMRLFSSVTLPSVARHVQLGAQWLLFVDERMDHDVRSRLEQELGEKSHDNRIRLITVKVLPNLGQRLVDQLDSYDEVRLIRIDDDDAVSDDFLSSFPQRRGLHTLPFGYEASLADRKLRVVKKPFLSLNTLFHGEVSLVKDYADIGHHRVSGWAEKVNLPVTVSESMSNTYIHSRHKQSDSSFGALRSQILRDPATMVFSQSLRARFGLDEDKFNLWRTYAANAPSAPSERTWDRTKELNGEAHRLLKRLDQIQSEVREATSNIFG